MELRKKSITRLFLILVMIIILCLVAARPVPGSEVSLETALLLVATDPAALSVIVGGVLSIVMEYIVPYEGLPKKWKRAVFYLINLLIPVGAALLGWIIFKWEPSIELWWRAVQAGVSAAGFGTLVHGYRPRRFGGEKTVVIKGY